MLIITLIDDLPVNFSPGISVELLQNSILIAYLLFQFSFIHIFLTGAIKFGDKLSVDECITLIGQLSQCNLPFQCAHGRPSLIPVLDIKLMQSKLQVNVSYLCQAEI